MSFLIVARCLFYYYIIMKALSWALNLFDNRLQSKKQNSCHVHCTLLCPSFHTMGTFNSFPALAGVPIGCSWYFSLRSQEEKAAQHCTANSLTPKATAGDREMGINHSRWRHKAWLSLLHPQQAPFLSPSSLVYPATKPVTITKKGNSRVHCYNLHPTRDWNLVRLWGSFFRQHEKNTHLFIYLFIWEQWQREMKEICCSTEESSTVLRARLKMAFIFTVLVQCLDSSSAKITAYCNGTHCTHCCWINRTGVPATETCQFA